MENPRKNGIWGYDLVGYTKTYVDEFDEFFEVSVTCHGGNPPKESDTMALASGCTKWAIFTRTSYQSLAEIFE